MIALDTSACAHYVAGTAARAITLVQESIHRGVAYLPPVALTELLSNTELDDEMRLAILALPLLPVRRGYWERAGMLRADLKRRELKAKIADVLIAQSCIDHDVPLITYDRDFRHFQRAGLQLL